MFHPQHFLAWFMWEEQLPQTAAIIKAQAKRGALAPFG